MFTDHGNHVTMGGQFAPNGQGVVVDGGYRLTGAWNFGSGTGHSQYIAAGFVPMDGGDMRWISEGIPELLVALLPRAEVVFTDGWNVQELKGTGSNDYNVGDLFVRDGQRGGDPSLMAACVLTSWCRWPRRSASSRVPRARHINGGGDTPVGAATVYVWRAGAVTGDGVTWLRRGRRRPVQTTDQLRVADPWVSTA
ncbi:MAG: hypothetical protein QOI01_6029 [Mycobacterium sp.]|nr:hypothetical protein [Mycobacterium sp.]